METNKQSVNILDGYCTPGLERETLLPTEELLRQMDSARVVQAVIAPQDREIAVRNAEGNNRILNLSKRSRGRLIPACAVNPWWGSDGLAELRRVVSAGARMLVLAPALQGFHLGDELADPLLGEAAALGIAVYVHTGPHSAAAPSQLVLLAQRHRSCRFVLGHCGSTDYAHDMLAVLVTRLPNLWFELSFVRPWALPVYGAAAGETRLIFGSSVPRNDLAYELEQFDLYWPIAQHPATYGANLLAVLNGMPS